MRFVIGALVSFGWCAALLAQEAAEINVDDFVVVNRRADVKVGNEVVDNATRGETLQVKEVQGNWLWVTRQASGWIHRRDVVPFDEAVAYFTEAVRRNPRSANAFQTRGYLWHERGEYDNALRDYNEALRLNPSAAVVLGHRGMAWTQKGELVKALADFDRAIELDANNAMFYNNRAAARHKQGEYDKAVADLDEAIRIDPAFAQAYQNRGFAWFEQGQHKKAIADFNEVIGLRPNIASAFKNRGNALKAAGEFARAISDFDRAIELDPKDPTPYNSLAWLRATCPQAEHRNGGLAVDIARKACQLTDWKNGVCLDTLASAYAEAGNFEEAVRWQTEALEHVPKDFDKAAAQARLAQYKAEKPFREE